METGEFMGYIAKALGQRIRSYRITKGFSQEKLAELASCHAAYMPTNYPATISVQYFGLHCSEYRCHSAHAE